MVLFRKAPLFRHSLFCIFQKEYLALWRLQGYFEVQYRKPFRRWKYLLFKILNFNRQLFSFFPHSPSMICYLGKTFLKFNIILISQLHKYIVWYKNKSLVNQSMVKWISFWIGMESVGISCIWSNSIDRIGSRLIFSGKPSTSRLIRIWFFVSLISFFICDIKIFSDSFIFLIFVISFTSSCKKVEVIVIFLEFEIFKQ